MDFGFSPSPFGGGDGGFSFIFSIFPVIFVIILAIVVIGFISSGARYVKNASSPRDSHFVKIVSKRMDVRHHSSHNNMNDSIHSSSSSHTYYYITLEFENGRRQEYLDVKNLYGLVAEGDVGYAAVQGDWIVAFERRMEQSGQERSRF